MNNIVLAVLQGVVVMAVAPFFSGLGRVIRAKMHNRSGPSIMQDYRDLAKLFARPESQSEDASFALRIMPPLFFAVAFMLAMGLPLFTAQSPIPVFGDAITIMYSLALARFFFAICGVDSSNAYAGIGGVRELLDVVGLGAVLAEEAVVGRHRHPADLVVVGRGGPPQPHQIPKVLRG